MGEKACVCLYAGESISHFAVGQKKGQNIETVNTTKKNIVFST